MSKRRPLLYLVLLVTLTLSLFSCQTLLPDLQPTPATPDEKSRETPELKETEVSTPEEEASAPGVEELLDKVPKDVRDAGFAHLYKGVPVTLPPDYYYSDYTLPMDLNRVENLSFYDGALSPEARALLEQNGFVATPGDWLEYFQLYESVRYQDQPVFVTTDAVFHVYHLLFDKLLRDLERDALAPNLEALSGALVEAAEVQYGEAQGTPLEGDALRVWAYFAVAQQLISENPPPIPAPVGDLVNEELALIRAHGGIEMSPVLTLPEAFAEGLSCDPNATPEQAEKFYCEDYSQYVPRGHYTRDELLERYFRTMMWYGRINLRLKHDRETRMALLITRLIRNANVYGIPAEEVWASIYDPTVFLVGKSDDLSFREYGALMDALYGPDPALTDLADPEKLATFRAAARQLPAPQVNSMWVYIWEEEDEATQGFRFMGQRFTLDAYIFEQLVWREVGEMGNERWLPKGLDVFAALGNEEAYAILEELGETEYANYDSQLAKVRGEIAALELDSWTQNVYWNWLYALDAVTAPKGEAYPPFMQTEAWARKDLHTALGSWTELKHDTILYAKQVMAEMGGGAPEVQPRGYVEPNPEAFARLLALTRMTQEGLAEQNILTDQSRWRLGELEETLVFLQRVAEDELAGTPLSEDDYARLKMFGGWLERMTLAAADTEPDSYSNVFNEDEQAAIVADVATDPNGFVLEEATGRIFEIFVVVPDGQGGLVLARGGIYSYYEFPWPMGDRLTNEAWRAMLEAGTQPDQPVWTSSFIAR
ncbi:MAG: DUF3160 domain-containing protein [Anaerolineales bacterium]